MRRVLATALACVFFGIAVHTQGGLSGDGRPVKFLGSCEADVTGDGRADLVQLVETVRGVELIAMVPTEAGGYTAFVLKRWKGDAGILKCEYGAQVTETGIGKSPAAPPRVLKTPGAYVHLVFPEASSVAYVWTKDRFVEIWTSD